MLWPGCARNWEGLEPLRLTRAQEKRWLLPARKSLLGAAMLADDALACCFHT